MDLDAFVAAHTPTWLRLASLSRSKVRTGAEADELVDLYQTVATHLSTVRSQAPDAQVVAYLSGLLSQARIRSVGTRPQGWSALTDFVVRRMPAALYLTRRWWLSTMVISYALTALAIVWLLAHPTVEQTLITPEQVDQLVTHDFADYYKQAAASHFATKVWTNNVWVSVQCLAFGIFFVPVLWVLLQNMLNLAIIGSIMIRHDRAALFFGLILPHGLLELTAVFLAAGVGLQLFWAWVAPGAQSRTQSLAKAGRSMGAVVIGLVGILGVSGVIEGFVTPSSLPTWARIGIGITAELAFLAYVFGPGRHAAKVGITGDVDERLRESELPSV